MTETAAQKDQVFAEGLPPGGVVWPLVLAGLVTLSFLTLPQVIPGADPDLSLSGLLSSAHQRGLQFGVDIVSTYGPWGFLVFPFFSPYAEGLRLCVDVGLGYTIAAGLCLVAWRLRLTWRCALLATFVYATPNISVRTDLILGVGLLCWGLLCVVESGPRLVMCCSVLTLLAVFCALAKLSFIPIGSLSIALVAGILCLRGQCRAGLGITLGFVGGWIGGWLAGGQKLAQVPAFLKTGLAVVQGYNETAGTEGLPLSRWCAYVVVTLTFATVLVRVLSAAAGPPRGNSASVGSVRRVGVRGLLLVWVACLLWLTWKHGFLRADPWHMLFFFGFAPVLALALDVLPCERPIARQWAQLLSVASCLASLITLQWLFFPTVQGSLQRPFGLARENLRIIWRPAGYWQRMEAALEAAGREVQLPRLRKIIGRSTVDVFSQQQSVALFNGLNLLPRPVPQGYAAATASLMQLNEQFYLSPGAPEYLLFGLNPIDRKFPPLEDALLLRDLLFNYRWVADEGKFLLLKQQSSEAPRLTLLRAGSVRPGERLSLREYGDAALWMQLELEPSPLGRLRRCAYKAPPVRLAVWGELLPGRLGRFRAPPPMLAAGFVASPLLLETHDVRSFYQDQALTHPTAYAVEPHPGTESLWQPEIRFRIYKIENQLSGSGREEVPDKTAPAP